MNDNEHNTNRPRRQVGPVTAAIRAMRRPMPWESDGSLEGEQRAATWEARRTIMDVEDRADLEALAAASMIGPRELAGVLVAWNERRGLSECCGHIDVLERIFGEGARETDPYPVAFTAVFRDLGFSSFTEH